MTLSRAVLVSLIQSYLRGTSDSFESPFGLELLATVHWSATREDVQTARDLAETVRAWNPAKRRFTPGRSESLPNG